MLQFDNIPFRSMKQNERKELLNRLLDLEKYEKLEEIIKPIYKKVDEEYNNINNIMKDINPKILEEELKNNTTILKNLSEKIENINKNIILEKIDELNKKYTCVYDEKESNNKKLIENKITKDECELDLIKIKKQKNLQDKTKLYLSEDTKNDIYKELEILNLKKKPLYEIKNNNSHDILMNKLSKIDEKDASYNIVKVQYEDIKAEYIKTEEEYKRLSKLKRQDKLKLKKQKIYEDKGSELKASLLSVELDYDKINIELINLNNLIEYDKNDGFINKIDIYMKDKTEVDQLKEEYNNNERIYKEYETHEYNVECEKCMKNPKIIELLRLRTNLNNISERLSEINLDNTISERKILYDNNNNEYNKLCVRKNESIEMIIKLKNELNTNNLLIQDCILESEINDLSKKLTKLREEKDKLYDKNVEFESLNEDRLDIEYELKLLLKNTIIQEENNDLDIKIKELNEKMKQYDKYMKVCNEIMKNDIEMKELDNRLIINKNELLKFKNNENNRILNENILNEICKLKVEYKILEKDNLELEKEKYKIENHNELIEKKIKLYNEKKEEYNKKKNERDTYFYYMEILHKNGISLSIINKYLEFVEEGVNNIIERFLNKRVKLSMDNNNIILNIGVDDENDKSCNILMLGGRETFIFDIAFKIILSKIGELPRSNFLFIDEGISVFDVNNLNGIGELFNYLNINYQYVFLISHLEQVKDMVNKIIYIKNDGTCSKIEILN
jgi:DNA repair exonuclease SbcCD ATPase subunit